MPRPFTNLETSFIILANQKPMKKCPQCGTQYSDITLSFCLQDGTPLVVAPQTDTPTVVLGETETVVPRRGAIRVPIDDSQPSGWGQIHVTRFQSLQPWG